MAVIVDFAFWGLAVTPVGKQVFLLLVATTPNAMHGMTTTATRQARMGVAGNAREPALEIFTDAHGRIGHSPVKPQIFL